MSGRIPTVGLSFCILAVLPCNVTSLLFSRWEAWAIQIQDATGFDDDHNVLRAVPPGTTGNFLAVPPTNITNA